MKDKRLDALLETPTLDQTTWVVTKIIENSLDYGFYRELIYERMGFGMESYIQLDTAGLLVILNALGDYFKTHPGEKEVMERRSKGWPFRKCEREE